MDADLDKIRTCLTQLIEALEQSQIATTARTPVPVAAPTTATSVEKFVQGNWYRRTTAERYHEILRRAEEDENSRINKNGVLYSPTELSRVDSFFSNGVGLPMLYKPGMCLPYLSIDKAMREFNNRIAIFHGCPEYGIQPFDMRDEDGGLFIAGGAVQKSLVRDSSPDGDIDCFIILPSRLHDAACDEQKKWAIDLYDRMLDYLKSMIDASEKYAKEYNKRINFRAHQAKSPNCVTINLDVAGTQFVTPYNFSGIRSFEIQFITRFYKRPADVLYDFDLGASAVGVWDNQIVCSSLGRLTLEMGINVLMLARRRATLELRIAKYFERGYPIVFPEVDPARFWECSEIGKMFILSKEKVCESRKSTLARPLHDMYCNSVIAAKRVTEGYAPPQYDDVDDLKDFNKRLIMKKVRYYARIEKSVIDQDDLPRSLVCYKAGLEPGIFQATPVMHSVEEFTNIEDYEKSKPLHSLRTTGDVGIYKLRTLGMTREEMYRFVDRVDEGTSVKDLCKIIENFVTPYNKKRIELAQQCYECAQHFTIDNWMPVEYRHNIGGVSEPYVLSSCQWYNYEYKFNPELSVFHVSE